LSEKSEPEKDAQHEVARAENQQQTARHPNSHPYLLYVDEVKAYAEAKAKVCPPNKNSAAKVSVENAVSSDDYAWPGIGIPVRCGGAHQ